ncbi:hypothetical protein [Lelliottia sp. RWM.1]|jgi:hypothetical protein|uniref:hypothetical protein n=1 Tax=Lelliottia sp. RWM.1 TaxID=2663242 RepID=UPI00193DE18F|nr:hypothetical protein [Lelliottia sp. RWM.1]MBM3071669.1 hypothetical protein [Lelliottia sp. RWM.1]
MDKLKISGKISITYQYSKSSPLYLVSLFDTSTGNYLSSIMSNNKESVILQIKEYAHLSEHELTQLRKAII